MLNISNAKRWCCESDALNMPANLENSAVATRLEKFSYHSNPIERQYQKCSNYCTIALISHASKVMPKTLQARLQQYVTKKFQMFKLDFEKTDKLVLKFPTSIGSYKKQEDSRKISTFTSLTTLKLLIMWITTNCKILKVMGIPDHLTCLLRNLCPGQETTVRTRHGTIDRFKTGKGVCQGCFFVTLLI